MAHFLVTGGAGFIGSHLVNRLIRKSHQVRILDDLSTGKWANVNPKADMIVGTICDTDTLSNAVADVDGIFHLAAVASVEASVSDWQACHEVNLTGTLNILNAAAGQKTKPKVVYASSAAVYGDTAITPLTETSIPNPLNPYGADKLGCEHHARAATLIHGVPTVGGRFFSVYGPRHHQKSPHAKMISEMVDKVIKGKPVGISSDGGPIQDFIYVGDVISWLMAAMASSHPHPSVFNVCTGRQTSMRIMAETLSALTGKPLRIESAPPAIGDIRQSTGDPSHAQKRLGFKAKTSLGDGLKMTIGGERRGRYVQRS